MKTQIHRAKFSRSPRPWRSVSRRLAAPPLRAAAAVLAAASAVVISAASEVLRHGRRWGGPHVGSFGTSHIGGLGVHPMGMSGVARDRGLDVHGFGRTHVTHELGHRHFRGLYGVSPLYDNNDCPWPADVSIESCPVGSDTE